MKIFFVTSSGTDIGKTLVTAALCHQLIAAGKKVRAIKPVACGVDDSHISDDDIDVLLKSMGQPITQSNIEAVSPFRYKAPLSPDMAARQEGKKLNFEALVKFCQQQQTQSVDYLFIEGIGGVMVPFDEKHTVLDLIEILKVPALLVVGSYLGTLSHTLTALYALRSRDIPVHAIIVSESENSTVPWVETLKSLAPFAGKTPVHGIRRCATVSGVWENLPDITGVIT